MAKVLVMLLQGVWGKQVRVSEEEDSVPRAVGVPGTGSTPYTQIKYETVVYFLYPDSSESDVLGSW